MMKHPMNQNKGGERRKSLSPLISANPIYDAFDRKYAIHAGMMGGDIATGDTNELFWQQLATPVAPNQAHESSIVAYAHVPFCSSRCLFCGFYAGASRADAMKDYASALSNEIRFVGNALKQSGRKIKAFYFGGGTPTDLSAQDISMAVSAVKDYLPLTADCEITLEGRFNDFTTEKQRAALEAGVNRFSLGAQTFNTEIRQRLGRKDDRETLIKTLERIVTEAEPFDAAVVIDLIYGLPGQTVDDVLKDIDTVANLTRIHGLDLYQINRIPGSPMVEQEAKLPPIADMKQQADMFLAGRGRLLEHGFERISTAHWRRSRRERNVYNSSIKQGVDCMPFGAGSGGRLGKYRFMQEQEVARYSAAILQEVKPVGVALPIPISDRLISTAIGMLEQGKLDLEALEVVAGFSVERILPELKHWQEAGLIKSGSPWRLTPAGEFWTVNLQQIISLHLSELYS